MSFLLCLQLALRSGEHQVAAAPVPAAEGGAAGGPRRGPRPQARPGALLRRLGPHTTDRGSGQAAAGPVLPHHRGTEEEHWPQTSNMMNENHLLSCKFRPRGTI